MNALPVITLVVCIALGIAWVTGEATGTAWLRRLAGPLFVLVACGVAVAYTAISTSFEGSMRYSAAMKRFVSAVIQTSERDGDEAAIDQLRRFDAISIETYEGGALLQWLAEPLEQNTEIQTGGQQNSEPD